MRRAINLATTLLLVTTAAFAGTLSPSTVSPGDESRFVEIESRCPTFSWSLASTGDQLELVVYRVDARSGEPQPLFRRTFSSTASSWTPSLDTCLERGRRYAWAVRAVREGPLEPWSPPRFFQLSSAPSAAEVAAAVEIVARYGATLGSSASPTSAPPPATPGVPEPLPLSEDAPPPASVFAAATAAIRGEMEGAAGAEVGLMGVSASTAGGGVLAANTSADGADLILDGSAQGVADTFLTQAAISVGGTTFDIGNAGGNLDLTLDGVSVVTTATDRDTTYSAGTGLNLASSVFSADTGYLQRRVSSACSAGSAIRAIEGNGTVTCQPDSDTTYSAGTGLLLAGDVFAANTDYLQRRVTDSCPSGSSIRAIGTTGSVTCETDDTGSGGGISTIVAGGGLLGGGSTSTVNLAVDFGGTGAGTKASRNDHHHSSAYVDQGGDTMTGALTISSSSPSLRLNTTGSAGDLRFQKSGSNRWSVGWNDGSKYLYFYDWLSPGGTRMVIEDDTGHVGIGSANPYNLLDVGGLGSQTGGVAGYAEVVARFKQTDSTKHSAVAIDSTKDAVLYLSKNGQAIWGLRFDDDDTVADDSFEIRYHKDGTTGGRVAMKFEPLQTQIDTVFTGFVFPREAGLSLGRDSPATRWENIFLANFPNVSSDERLKDAIETLPYGLDEVRQMRPVAFTWRDNPDSGRHLGLIAQEVEPLVPEAVHRGRSAEDLWSMTYSSLVPVLIHAIQEQQQMIESLEARLQGYQATED